MGRTLISLPLEGKVGKSPTEVIWSDEVEAYPFHRYTACGRNISTSSVNFVDTFSSPETAPPLSACG